MKITEWLMLTYDIGVGGFIWIIGSAADITAMSKIKELNFISYLYNVLYLIIAYIIGYFGMFVTVNWFLG